jgi:hypothetical protein
MAVYVGSVLENSRQLLAGWLSDKVLNHRVECFVKDSSWALQTPVKAVFNIQGRCWRESSPLVRGRNLDSRQVNLCMRILLVKIRPPLPFPHSQNTCPSHNPQL